MSGTAAAIVSESGQLSRDELEREVTRWAALLRSRGAGPAGRVAWLLPNRPEVLTVALAARRIGAQAVALGGRSTPGELAGRLAVAQPAVVVASGAARELLELLHGKENVLDADDPPEPAGDPGIPRAAADGGRLGAGASLLFTSGTTGSPKAALRTRGDRRLSDAIARGFRLGPSSRFLVGGPLYHSGPWTCALMTLSLGGTVVLLPRFDERSWLDSAVEHRCDSGFLTPTQLARLVSFARARPGPRPPLSHVVVSGEPFPDRLKRAALDVFGEGFVECYGCTELGPMCALPAEEFLARPGSCGRPFDGVRIAAFRGARRLPAGEAGTLRALTPLAFDGYVSGPGQTPAGRDGDWGSVGDVGFVDEEGYVHLAGRDDDLIITGGVNVFPSDVEEVLAGHPDVEACAVFGLPDPRWGEVVAAAVRSGRRLELAEVRDWLRGRIADDRRPRRLFLVDELPVTATGKLARRVLRERAAREPVAG
ncbi:class I adenylate-forming enzyme family protein [Amycolatopsis rubida]|uniref:Fatty-acyl-CoA synthase/long-chain acyl-CoA synthetase/malonyl-CoA/methylmalonyl-CoA synthetase n=1 Tax=Amycolatopsis rubida TaxID=112413 RepID=A0A1I5SB84_9PSEU|nr:AMP-binding protein [Amycolatopsis rubida]SFP67979.1 fatty-acyl-CoA synthase/long-chain acyl-CoA synthetase/malonyl-CoA/methylmalonyl-CoA synthetase [Amycolatopsis rubida]